MRRAGIPIVSWMSWAASRPKGPINGNAGSGSREGDAAGTPCECVRRVPGTCVRSWSCRRSVEHRPGRRGMTRCDGRTPCRMADRERIGERSPCRPRTLQAVFVRTRNMHCSNHALNESITKMSQCGDILFIHKTDRHINVHKSGMHTKTCHEIYASNAAFIRAGKNFHSAKCAGHGRSRVAYSGNKPQPAMIHRAAKERMSCGDRIVDSIACCRTIFATAVGSAAMVLARVAGRVIA